MWSAIGHSCFPRSRASSHISARSTSPSQSRRSQSPSTARSSALRSAASTSSSSSGIASPYTAIDSTIAGRGEITSWEGNAPKSSPVGRLLDLVERIRLVGGLLTGLVAGDEVLRIVLGGIDVVVLDLGARGQPLLDLASHSAP